MRKSLSDADKNIEKGLRKKLEEAESIFKKQIALAEKFLKEIDEAEREFEGRQRGRGTVKRRLKAFLLWLEDKKGLKPKTEQGQTAVSHEGRHDELGKG